MKQSELLKIHMYLDNLMKKDEGKTIMDELCVVDNTVFIRPRAHHFVFLLLCLFFFSVLSYFLFPIALFIHP